MEIEINARIDSNWDDRRNFLGQKLKIWCSKKIPNEILLEHEYTDREREDDTISITVNIQDLLNAIGKAIINM